MTSVTPPPVATAAASSPPMASDSITENIHMMRLLHELKAEFPAVPDEFVKQCIAEHGQDRPLCVDLLSAESERLKRSGGPLKGRYNLQALLSHQMQQRLNLELELRNKRESLVRLRGGVLELKERLDQKEMLRMGPFGIDRDVTKKTKSLQKDISELQQSCNRMADEVTKLTHGTVPLCETSIEFYESLAENAFPPAQQQQPVPAAAVTATAAILPTQHSLDTTATQQVPQPPPMLPPSSSSTSLSMINNNNHSSNAPINRSISQPHSNNNNRSRNPSALTQGGPRWSCSVCTFMNHPALDRCEFCEMPRIVGAGSTSSVASTSSATTVPHRPAPPPPPQGASSPAKAPGSSGGCFCHPDDPEAHARAVAVTAAVRPNRPPPPVPPRPRGSGVLLPQAGSKISHGDGAASANGGGNIQNP